MWTCIECENEYTDEIDGDAEERMCFECLNNDTYNCYICEHIFKEDEPSWYDEETKNHTCDKCEENKEETEGEDNDG